MVKTLEGLPVASAELIAECTHQMNGAVGIFHRSNGILESFKAQSRVHGWFDVGIHGSNPGEEPHFSIYEMEDGKIIQEWVVEVRQLAEVIRNARWRFQTDTDRRNRTWTLGSKWSQALPIRLFACRAGRAFTATSDDASSPARQLAVALGTEVLSSNVRNLNTGRGFAGLKNDEPGDVEYQLFHPTGASRLTPTIPPGGNLQDALRKIAGGR